MHDRHRGAGVLATLAAVIVAGCGGSAGGSGAGGPPPGTTRVAITVDRDGDGPRAPRTTTLRCPAADRRAACRALRSAPPRLFRPLPPDRACSQIYGGPQTARVRGIVEGRRVDARFDRHDGCGVARWERLAAVFALTAR